MHGNAAAGVLARHRIQYDVASRPPGWSGGRHEASGRDGRGRHGFDARPFVRGNGSGSQDFLKDKERPAEGFHFVARVRAAGTE